MLFLRALGKTLLFLAFLALAFDGARSLATPDQGLLFASASTDLKVFLPGGAADLQQKFLLIGPSWFWTVFIGPLLLLPMWMLLGGLGAALYMAGFRQPLPVLYSE
jgi:hypothetical protein